MPTRIFLALTFFCLLAACAESAPAQLDSSTPTESSVSSWQKDAVFYEIFVRSYYDTNNDGIGDFNGITQKLDYLQQLGVNALWLMPIHPSPSYHGYDITDYYAVNAQYGTMSDFENLLTQAHQRDMHIIIDLVLNHTSNQHAWFVEANNNPDSKYRDYYVWSDQSHGNGWHRGNSGFYFGLFWEGMPDLNYNNPLVSADMQKVTEFWLNDIGVDGFRVDAAKHLIEEGDKTENTPATHAWFKNFYKAYKTKHPQAYTVGEVYGAGASVVKSYSGDQLDQIFNFEISNGIINSVNGGANSGINSAITFANQDMPSFNFASFLTNHDQNRVMSVFNGDINKAKLAAFLMLTLPATPYIYYGEELGMSGQKPDEDIRLPMQWSAEKFAGFSTKTPWRTPAPDYEKVNVNLQLGNPHSLLEHYRALLTLRKSHPALANGKITLIKTNNPAVYAALSVNENETLLILVNLKNEPMSDYGLIFEDAEIKKLINAAQVIYSNEKNKSFTTLDAYATYVLKIK